MASPPLTSLSSGSILGPSITLQPPAQIRARSSSTPLSPGLEPQLRRPVGMPRTSSHLLSPRSKAEQERRNALDIHDSTLVGSGSEGSSSSVVKKVGRARSASLVTVKEVGSGDGLEASDLGSLGTENWQWVDGKGVWLMHPMLILLGKLLVDAIPGMNHELSWTITNCGYMIISYLVFHAMAGLPFENMFPTGGAYDDLTLWEQIDNGAQYTPAKKWLTSVPIGLFLISTHYTKYNPVLFLLNFAAVTFVLIPKLPVLHRLRFQFLEPISETPASSPHHSRAPSPIGGKLASHKEHEDETP